MSADAIRNLESVTFRHLDHYIEGRIAEYRALITLRLTGDDGRPLAARVRARRAQRDEDLRKAASAFLSYVQFLYLRIAKENVCERLLYHGINTSISSTFDLLHPFVLNERKRTKADDLYMEAENLVEAWKERRPCVPNPRINGVFSQRL